MDFQIPNALYVNLAQPKFRLALWIDDDGTVLHEVLGFDESTERLHHLEKCECAELLWLGKYTRMEDWWLDYTELDDEFTRDTLSDILETIGLDVMWRLYDVIHSESMDRITLKISSRRLKVGKEVRMA